MDAAYGFAEKRSYGQDSDFVQSLLFVDGNGVSDDNFFNW